VRATWASLGLLLSGLGALLLFAALVLSILLCVVVVGVYALRLLMPLADGWGIAWRRRVGLRLDREIPGPPRPSRPSATLLGSLATWARDPVRWRNLGHLGFSGTAGGFLSGLPLLAVLGVIIGVEQATTASQNGATWWWMAALAVGGAAVWWAITPWVAQARLVADAAILGGTRVSALERRVAEVTRTRAESLDLAAAELRRIERDLHDGAQARLVSLGMNLGLAQDLMATDPEAADQLLQEARRTTNAALEDLRGVVRDIRPPVLSDRGLVGAVEALALDVAVPVTVTADVPGRLPDPVESAAYFAVNEIFANVVKHSDASHAFADLVHGDGRLTITVVDNGRGGADIAAGTGLAGVARRLAALDGTLQVDSPAGGPTRARLEVPCELSSPRTTPSSSRD